MSESTFSADLDALVRGEPIAPNDELTRFASDMYEEEQNVTIPTALKLRIANDLGLAAANEPTTIAAPVSRRTMRAAEPQRRSSRPWAIALVIAAAILVALTGILRWGMPTSDNESDNRFLFATPAVPTVAATPSASPEISEWMVPYTDADCPEDELLERSEWMEVQNERAASFDQTEQRVDEPYSVPSAEDAEAAATRQRQAMACINRGESIADRTDALPFESPRRAWETSVHASTTQEDRYFDRIERSKAFSSYAEDELGITVSDLVHETDGEPGRFWDPANAIQMADGRIALIPSWTTNSADSTDEFLTFAPVWIEVDGEWLLDEELFFCMGDCDEHWQERESVFPNKATPVESPELHPDAEKSWLQPIDSEECQADVNDLVSSTGIEADTSRSYQFIGPANANAADAAMQTSRQAFECSYPDEFASPLSMDELDAMNQEFSPQLIAYTNRIPENSTVVSEIYQDEVGLEPGDVSFWVGGDYPQAEGLSEQVEFLPNPEFAIELDDGRIVVPVVHVTFDERADSGPRSIPVTITPAHVLVRDNGDWVIDEVLYICLGECISGFQQMEQMMHDGGWVRPIEAIECNTNQQIPDGFSVQEEVAIRSRQYRACELSGEQQPLQGPEYRETTVAESKPVSDEIVSLLHTQGDAASYINRYMSDLQLASLGLPFESVDYFDPNGVVQLTDGRYAVIETTTIPFNTEEPTVGTPTAEPDRFFTAKVLIWASDGDDWVLDEAATVCLGDCEAYWAEADLAACEMNGFVPDYQVNADGAVNMWAEPGIVDIDTLVALDPNTRLMWLCESAPTSNPDGDLLEEDQVWMLFRTEDGTEGWVRQVDVRDYEP